MRKPKELSLDLAQPPCTVHRRVKYGEGLFNWLLVIAWLLRGRWIRGS